MVREPGPRPSLTPLRPLLLQIGDPGEAHEFPHFRLIWRRLSGFPVLYSVSRDADLLFDFPRLPTLWDAPFAQGVIRVPLLSSGPNIQRTHLPYVALSLQQGKLGILENIGVQQVNVAANATELP